MSGPVFSLDTAKKALAWLQRRSMTDVRLAEPYDLEALLRVNKPQPHQPWRKGVRL